MGVDIFLHSVRLVLNNLRTALRISLPLFLLFAVPSLVIGLVTPEPTSADQMGAVAAPLLGLGLISLVAGLVILPWIATAWHRYILLDEVPDGLFPAFSGRRVLAYFGYSFVIGLLAMLAALVAGGAVALVLAPLFGWAGGAVAGIVGMGVALVIGYRLAPILPEVALDRQTSIPKTLQSSPITISTIVVLAIISAVASFVLNLPVYGLAVIPGVGGLLGQLWSLGATWLQMLVGVSILTTIYGHYVEGRALPAR